MAHGGYLWQHVQVQNPNPAPAFLGFLTLLPQPHEPDCSSLPGTTFPFQALVPEPRAAQKVKAQVQLAAAAHWLTTWARETRG